MATYLAPGVYVEEVPSTQQPIAGVGTNTVGFIGVVPDEIQCPVPNEGYDPQLAEAAAAGPEVGEKDTRKLEQELRTLEQQLTQAQQAVEVANANVAGLNPEDPGLTREQKRYLRDRDLEARKLEQVKSDLERKGQELEELRQPAPRAEGEFLKPYTMETHRVTANPYDARLCTNFTDYTNAFGPFSADDPKAPGTALHTGHRALTHAVYGFFRNGGTRCFVVRVKSDNAAEVDKALQQFEPIAEIAVVAAPGLDGKPIWQSLAAHCQKMNDRFAVLDGAAELEKDGELDVTRLSYSASDSVLPDRDRNAAFYFPHIQVIDPAKQLQDEDPTRRVRRRDRGRIYVPPSGHVAGIYARVDAQRGVHKAPGNEAILGALGVKYYIGGPRQTLLNPQGVNCIRNIHGSISVYGARTIGGDKNGEWKYVNVRRVLLFLRDSIDQGTQWVVFEPNDPALWAKIRRNVRAFLTNVWRSGALFGLTPQEAFYVKCDEETNPPEVRDVGQVVTEIGVAIVRPAEFVIFRLSQWAGPSAS